MVKSGFYDFISYFLFSILFFVYIYNAEHARLPIFRQVTIALIDSLIWRRQTVPTILLFSYFIFLVLVERMANLEAAYFPKTGSW